ncbi:hypothetical protein [Actinomadura oligospora]|uniref:hypothetical protein n=1 Tax=Actinomadura oligospora TaxID=111804 RepID=UPI00047BE9DC|nr:hypothetical protein [Actinomadura oligospora]
MNAGSGDRGEAFTACLRSHGVKDFPGITIGEDGTIQLKTGGSVNPLSATYKAAAKACASLLPKGSTLPGEPTPPSPSAPTPSFSCGSDCPAPPKVPELRF